MPLGLLGTYASPDDLAYKVRRAIESDLNDLGLGPIGRRSTGQEARLRARPEVDRIPSTNTKGQVRYNNRYRLVVHNGGGAVAERVRVDL